MLQAACSILAHCWEREREASVISGCWLHFSGSLLYSWLRLLWMPIRRSCTFVHNFLFGHKEPCRYSAFWIPTTCEFVRWVAEISLPEKAGGVGMLESKSTGGGQGPTLRGLLVCRGFWEGVKQELSLKGGFGVGDLVLCGNVLMYYCEPPCKRC